MVVRTPQESLDSFYDSRGRGTLVAFGPETLEQGLRLGEVFKGLLEMVGIVAKGDKHVLNRVGDGGRVELKDTEAGGIVGRLRGVVLGRHLWSFLSRVASPRSFGG